MAITVSLINMKGGVGKTTMASQLAHAADTDNLRVLAVDLDPQSDLSRSMMGSHDYANHLKDNRPTIVQVFDEYIPAGGEYGSPRRIDLEHVIVKEAGYCSDSTLDLIPSRRELCRTLKNPTGKEQRLAEALAQISGRYDLVLIDCAPTESILTDAAYFASRYVIVPVKPEFMAAIGIPLLALSISDFQLKNDDHTIEIAGLVFNLISYQKKPEEQKSVEEVRKEAQKHGWHIFDNQVSNSASYPRAEREGTPLEKTKNAHTYIINQFKQLKKEIFDKLGVGRSAT